MTSQMPTLQEIEVNIISEGTRIDGEMTFDQVTRIHGVLMGKVRSKEGSTLILSETAVVEGSIEADTLMVDGFVRGDILAKTRVIISRTGRVCGNIQTASLVLEFGAFFEGRCQTEKPKLAPSVQDIPSEITV